MRAGLRTGARNLVCGACAVLMSASIAYATGALGPEGNERAAAVGPLVDDDGDRPVFELPNLRPGDSHSGCIAVTNAGTVPVSLSLSATQTGTLAPYLRLSIARGTSSADGSGCTGFTQRAVVFAGTLDQITGVAIADPAVLGAGASATYRYTAGVVDDGSAQGLESIAAFTFTASAADAHQPPSPPVATPPTCAPLAVTRSRLRVRAARKLRVVVRARPVGDPATPLLLLRAKVKTRRGKPVRKRTWRRITYRLAGSRVAESRRRPFTAAFAADLLQPGANELRVRIKRRKAKAVKSRFRIQLVKGDQGCELRLELAASGGRR